MVLTSSMENYLKAVFTLRQIHGRVRCIHIAERMDVTLPSVSRAVKELEKMGHVSRDEDGSRHNLRHLEKELPQKFMSATASTRNG